MKSPLRMKTPRPIMPNSIIIAAILGRDVQVMLREETIGIHVSGP